MRPVSDFIDQWGLLDKLYKPDGGDTCQREGMYWSLLRILIQSGADYSNYVRWKTTPEIKFNEVFLRNLHPSPGVLLRHSNPDYDASDWDRMSRDQLQPTIIAFGYWGKKQLWDLTKGHLKRGFIFCNNTRRNGATKRNHGKDVQGEVRNYTWKLPDITGPEIWANFVRAHKAWWAYPLLFILDIELLLGAIKWSYFPRHNIAMNQTLSMMQAWHRLRTPWSWLAVKICPIEYMIEHIEDHFNDFHSHDDMQFFGPMFKEAWENIK